MQVLLVEDKQLLADYIIGTLQNSLNVKKIEQLESFDELKQVEESLSDFDYVLVDTGLYDRSSLEVIRFITGLEKGPQVIALADLSDPTIVSETFKYKVLSYVSNDHDLEGFEKTLKKTFDGDMQYTRKTRKEMKKWVDRNISFVSSIEISKREREILRMICEEKTSVEIAGDLFISEHTVLTHRKNLLKKVGAKNTVGLVKYAVAHKLVSI